MASWQSVQGAPAYSDEMSGRPKCSRSNATNSSWEMEFEEGDKEINHSPEEWFERQFNQILSRTVISDINMSLATAVNWSIQSIHQCCAPASANPARWCGGSLVMRRFARKTVPAELGSNDVCNFAIVGNNSNESPRELIYPKHQYKFLFCLEFCIY